MKQEGVAPEAGILPRLASYESLRWYGNGTVQAALWIPFLISFMRQHDRRCLVLFGPHISPWAKCGVASIQQRCEP